MPLSSFPILERPSNLGVLEACDQLAFLPAGDRARVAMHSFMAFAERGETIWTEHSRPQFAGVVGRGLVSLTRMNSTGTEIPVKLVPNGEAFGLEAICAGKPQPAGVVAEEPTWYLKIPAQVVLALLCHARQE